MQDYLLRTNSPEAKLLEQQVLIHAVRFQPRKDIACLVTQTLGQGFLGGSCHHGEELTLAGAQALISGSDSTDCLSHLGLVA